MMGTFLPLVFFPAETWTHIPYEPTLEGQYIIKNLILIGRSSADIAVLNRTLFRPINKILQRREMMGEEARDEAVRISASANKRVAEYEAALRKARGDGYREAELARLQGLSESESKLSSTREEIKETGAYGKASA